MKTIKSDVKGVDALALFWSQYFPEIPVCSHPDCGCVAAEVDAFFPYIDDFNRCEDHPLELMNSRRESAPVCGHASALSITKRSITKRSCSGNSTAKFARITWWPPR